MRGGCRVVRGVGGIERTMGGMERGEREGCREGALWVCGEVVLRGCVDRVC